ncbi:hypothetical protein HDU76_007642 [Blyttiomyces sp. JEL0837]|nr:hypothetical protein HDU76_007642 [Blyttiomyces sp. JEL0837]
MSEPLYQTTGKDIAAWIESSTSSSVKTKAASETIKDSKKRSATTAGMNQKSDIKRKQPHKEKSSATTTQKAIATAPKVSIPIEIPTPPLKPLKLIKKMQRPMYAVIHTSQSAYRCRETTRTFYNTLELANESIMKEWNIYKSGYFLDECRLYKSKEGYLRFYMMGGSGEVDEYESQLVNDVVWELLETGESQTGKGNGRFTHFEICDYYA